MCEKGPLREDETTPPRMPDTTPPNYPSPTHDFTLQAVMHMQETIGGLVEAVESLKDQSKERDRKLDEIVKEIHSVGRDVHAAKAIGRTLLWVIGAVGALLGTVIGACLQGRFSRPPVDPHPQTLSAPSSMQH